jgi:uncharacterized membrane protein
MSESARVRRRRPAHPLFTAFPVAAYVFAAAFDVASAAAGQHHQWSAQLWHAGTFLLLGGLAICLVTMGTGFLDLLRFWPETRDALMTSAIHICVMAGVFMAGAGDIAWRLSDYHTRPCTPPGVAVLSLVTAAAAVTGAFFGGKLVFRYGVGVAGMTGGQEAQEVTGMGKACRDEGLTRPPK